MGHIPQNKLPHTTTTWQDELAKLLVAVNGILAEEAEELDGDDIAAKVMQQDAVRNAEYEYVQSQNRTLREANELLAEERSELRAKVRELEAEHSETVRRLRRDIGVRSEKLGECIAIVDTDGGHFVLDAPKVIRGKLNELQSENAKLKSSLGCDDHWVWSDTKDNDVATMGDHMRVSITGSQLRELISGIGVQDQALFVEYQQLVYHAMRMLDALLSTDDATTCVENFKERCDTLAAVVYGLLFGGR
jgi:hypothetical protein